jgi:plasmid stabilization system protein ParE
LQYLAADAISAARNFEDDVFACFERIGRHPEIGVQIQRSRRMYRRFRVSSRFHNWLVIYRRIDPQTLEIVRVLHGARDIGSILESPK